MTMAPAARNLPTYGSSMAARAALIDCVGLCPRLVVTLHDDGVERFIQPLNSRDICFDRLARSERAQRDLRRELGRRERTGINGILARLAERVGDMRGSVGHEFLRKIQLTHDSRRRISRLRKIPCFCATAPSPCSIANDVAPPRVFTPILA